MNDWNPYQPFQQVKTALIVIYIEKRLPTLQQKADVLQKRMLKAGKGLLYTLRDVVTNMWLNFSRTRYR